VKASEDGAEEERGGEGGVALTTDLAKAGRCPRPGGDGGGDGGARLGGDGRCGGCGARTCVVAWVRGAPF